LKSLVLLGIWEKFHQNDIEIPYPQRDLHIKTPIEIKQEST
jgi:small-conductance mechanosensitive channel